MDCYLSRFVQCLPPDTAGIVSGPDTVCKSANSVTFSVDHITNASHYSWTVPPGAVITAGNDSDSIDVWFGPGSNSGFLSVYGYNYCGTGDSSYVFINVIDAPIITLDGPDTLCLNTIASYSTTNGMILYNWDVSSGGNIVSGGSALDDTVVIEWNATGQQWVEVNAFDISGCAAYAPGFMNVVVEEYDTAEITIVAEAGAVCSGNPVTFTATPIFGGMNPSFQWQVNGINAGTNSSIFTYIPDSADQVNCILTSSEICVTGNPAISNQVIMEVYPVLPVSISVAAASNPVCEGDAVAFTASTSNSGVLPVFQWFVNGIPVGTNDSIYTYTPLDGDQVYCTLTSSETCTTNNPATSNTIITTVYPNLLVTITITTQENPVCEGETVTFIASTSNKGNLPVFQWFVNGSLAGTNDSVYTYTPISGDQVSCILTSSEQCTANNPATSNTITMIVNPLLPVGITITSSANPVCEGIPVTFSGAAINGGSTPAYQWQVNGINAGMNNAVFSYTPVDGDVVSCILTSNAECITNNPATSNSITMSVVEAPLVTFTTCFDTTTTINAKPYKLKGGIPLGGLYSGPGVNQVTGYFNPAMAGVGSHQIEYRYINFASCSDLTTRSIQVFPSSLVTCGTSFIDIRDNTNYPTVQIGSQCWMAANLDFGSEVPHTGPQRDNCIPEKYKTAIGSWQLAVYQWNELMCYSDEEEIQGLCSPGWHVPSDADWITLFANWTNNAFAGAPLKYSGYSGFNALMAGAEFFNKGWEYDGFATFFWSSTSHGPWKAWAHGMNDYNHSVSFYPSYRANAFSVRCVRD